MNSVATDLKRERMAAKRKVGAKRKESPLIRALDDIDNDGTLSLGRGVEIRVSSLDKPFWKKPRIAKRELFRYYLTVADHILPSLKDRPLVLKRFPDGIEGFSFFQQKAPDDPPEGVRVERIQNDEGEEQDRVIGGSLATLLHLVQLGCVSMDPWHSRVQNCDSPDYIVLDLDPQPKAGFKRVVDVALLVREELDRRGLHGVPKTSGSRGIHIYVPLPLRTTYADGLALAKNIAGRVAAENPKLATVERTVKERSPSSVYVDYLQNLKSKSVAAAYAVRAKPRATVSTPLEWDEVDNELDLRDFTIATAPSRFAKIGDIWNPAMKRRNRRDRIGVEG